MEDSWHCSNTKAKTCKKCQQTSASYISLKPVLSKIAEEYVVEEFLKPAVLKKVDAQQFGTIPGSNTTHALISRLHSWNNATDAWNGATARIVLFDFKKAFDLIDHYTLFRSFCRMKF